MIDCRVVVQREGWVGIDSYHTKDGLAAFNGKASTKPNRDFTRSCTYLYTNYKAFTMWSYCGEFFPGPFGYSHITDWMLKVVLRIITPA